ncbi:MAG TPA: methyltransferase domain-containing protein [Chloroflexia bacterium]|nr:methyltransferase domain-containing protein [Chloroflexia bacterium]
MLRRDILSTAKLAGKRALYPGLDLHTRCRYRYLPRLFRRGSIYTLDAGFGNGALSYAAYRRGNRVLGVSVAERDVEATTALFDFMRVPRESVEFKLKNIYDLRDLNLRFDQIICSETLEHIARDDEVIQMFADLLTPGGRLVLCCPYALHPEHNLGRTNEPETGYHVRDGYTLASYRRLLEPTGLRVTKTLGLGSPLLCRLDWVLRHFRARFGQVAAIPLFLLLLPLTRLDRTNPRVPFSLALVAEKEAGPV